MKIPEIRTKALGLAEKLDKDFCTDVESSEFDINLNKLHTLLELLPTDKPKPSKSLGELAEKLLETIKDECSFGGLPYHLLLPLLKRILTKSGLVMPVELKSKCCDANLRLLKDFDYREALRNIDSIKLQCIDCEAIDMVTLTPTAIEVIK